MIFTERLWETANPRVGFIRFHYWKIQIISAVAINDLKPWKLQVLLVSVHKLNNYFPQPDVFPAKAILGSFRVTFLQPTVEVQPQNPGCVRCSTPRHTAMVWPLV